MIFSVLIPVYNAERFLQDALDSVASQTFDDFEVIILNDGSTDSSLDIIQRFAERQDNVVVLDGPNRGLLMARRALLKAAKGEYIVFLDADDAFRTNALERCAHAIYEYGADVISYHHSRKSDFSIKASDDFLSPGLYEKERYELVKQCVCRGRFNSLWGKAVRLRAIDKNAVYSEYKGLMHGEDLFQLLPIIDRAESLVQLDDILYFYRPSEESSTSRYRPSQLKDIVTVNRRLINYACKWGCECFELSAIGETRQYINLLKMVEDSKIKREDKQSCYSSIREAMVVEGTFERCFAKQQRTDDFLILLALRYNFKTLLRWLLIGVETAKRLVGRFSSK